MLISWQKALMFMNETAPPLVDPKQVIAQLRVLSRFGPQIGRFYAEWPSIEEWILSHNMLLDNLPEGYEGRMPVYADVDFIAQTTIGGPPGQVAEIPILLIPGGAVRLVSRVVEGSLGAVEVYSIRPVCIGEIESCIRQSESFRSVMAFELTKIDQMFSNYTIGLVPEPKRRQLRRRRKQKKASAILHV